MHCSMESFVWEGGMFLLSIYCIGISNIIIYRNFFIYSVKFRKKKFFDKNCQIYENGSYNALELLR